MAAPDTCPRCSSDRLAVIYYDAAGQPIGGHRQCTDCGPRHSELIELTPELSEKLLERKAS